MNASEIFNEVGRDIDSVVEALDLTGGSLAQYRAFTVSDIAQIITDAKAESKLQNDKLEFENIELNTTINTLHNLCVSAEKRVLQKVAESKGVCEWRLNHTLHHVSACGGKYFIEPSRHFQFCPGCGKEVKVV